jgi:integrase
VRERLGTRKLQSITNADIEDLVDWMLTAGRRRGGEPGTALGARSVRLTLGRLKAAFEMAVDEGKLVRNVVKLVQPPEYRPQERGTWSQTEVRTFLRAASQDRLHGVPISIVSKWAGHYDSAFTMRTYVHASDEDLEQARQALAKIHKIAYIL